VVNDLEESKNQDLHKAPDKSSFTVHPPEEVLREGGGDPKVSSVVRGEIRGIASEGKREKRENHLPEKKKSPKSD